MEVAEEDGVLGRFCPGGAIMRMQVHTAAVRLTVTRTAGRALQGPVMSVLMKEEIAGDQVDHHLFKSGPLTLTVTLSFPS